jgi:cysteine synthase
MYPFDFPTEITDADVHRRAVETLREGGVLLPTFAQLAEPSTIPEAVLARLASVDPDAPDPANLFRVHWYNDAARRGLSEVPGYLDLPRSLTGVSARIVVSLGERFPMIGAHKVLAAYACLAPRIVAGGGFDPARQRAVWPSTGNYCRGGVAISRILGCRGVAVLPEGMSAERFEWLRDWVGNHSDIIRTPGSESNVKEIYDKCAELERDPANVILNQFSEFGNYLSHYLCTGKALARIFEELQRADPDLRLAAFVAGSGSAGTLGAGDHLKEVHGARIAVVEPVECPTLLYNGYGAHNIQGIGDKHVPLIHNIMNGDLVVGISDESTDALDLLFNSDEGRTYLAGRKGWPPALIESLASLGLSGIANVLGAIKTARRLELGERDVVVTVATDSARLYGSERDKWRAARFSNGFDEVGAAEIFGAHLLRPDGDHLLETTQRDRQRIFNLGYFTWVEQQGVALADFDKRKDQRFWTELRDLLPVWDDLIERFNRDTGLGGRAGRAA